jgi:hypothetical protein
MLRPHQIAPAAALLDVLRTSNAAVDWSDMGIGKTYVAAWVVAQLRIPTLAVVPKISISAWHAAAAAFGDTISVINYEALRTGRHPFGKWDFPPRPASRFFICTNCQRKFNVEDDIPPCYCRTDSIHCFDTRRKPQRLGKFTFDSRIGLVVFDEVHRCGGTDSLNAEMLIGAKRSGCKILGLSATPASSPLDLRALGYVLGLHKLGDFYLWASRLGVRRIPGGGIKWMASRQRQIEIMAGLRAQVIPAKGIRVTIAEVPDFPECEIRAQLYDLEKSGRIDELYLIMADALARLKNTRLNDKSPEHPLTVMLRAHQEIELLKIPIVCERVSDYNAKGVSCAIFCNYSQTITELSARLGITAIIDGTPHGVKHRQESIDAFQSNKVQNILANSKAGGVSISLPDLDGFHPRAGLVLPGTSAVDFRQLCGRLPRHGGKSRSIYDIILANSKGDRAIHQALSLKLNNLDALTDADLSPENLRFSV